jgi:hypothetical protein
VKVADTVRSFKEICEGQHDGIPEQAFYMKGGIEQVIAAAGQAKPDAVAARKDEGKKPEEPAKAGEKSKAH